MANGNVVSTEWSCRRRRVTPGTELSIIGKRGRFRFQRHVRTCDGKEWIDVVAPNLRYRTFHPDQVRTVHRATR